MVNAIEVHGLQKRFGAVRALSGLDLTVRSGEVHAFLGPNGAGKTTTLRILLGLLRADAGEARLLGGDPWRDATRLHRRLAYVPGDVTLWPNLSGGEIIDLLGRLHGGFDPQRRTALCERFALDPAKKARAYSKGNRQKVALVAALASDAELLLLDEPTSGLDPIMEATFRECVEEERRAVAATAYTFRKAYTPATRAQLQVTAGHNPAFLFLYGKSYATSVGALTAWRYGVWASILASLVAIFLVVRHTRADEEAGRLELIGAGVVGRHAPLTVALVVASTGSVLLAVLIRRL